MITVQCHLLLLYLIVLYLPSQADSRQKTTEESFVDKLQKQQTEFEQLQTQLEATVQDKVRLHAL